MFKAKLQYFVVSTKNLLWKFFFNIEYLYNFVAIEKNLLSINK